MIYNNTNYPIQHVMPLHTYLLQHLYVYISVYEYQVCIDLKMTHTPIKYESCHTQMDQGLALVSKRTNTL